MGTPGSSTCAASQPGSDVSLQPMPVSVAEHDEQLMKQALTELEAKCRRLESREKWSAAILGCVLVTLVSQTPLWHSWRRLLAPTWARGRRVLAQLVLRPLANLFRSSTSREAPEGRPVARHASRARMRAGHGAAAAPVHLAEVQGEVGQLDEVLPEIQPVAGVVQHAVDAGAVGGQPGPAAQALQIPPALAAALAMPADEGAAAGAHQGLAQLMLPPWALVQPRPVVLIARPVQTISGTRDGRDDGTMRIMPSCTGASPGASQAGPSTDATAQQPAEETPRGRPLRWQPPEPLSPWLCPPPGHTAQAQAGENSAPSIHQRPEAFVKEHLDAGVGGSAAAEAGCASEVASVASFRSDAGDACDGGLSGPNAPASAGGREDSDAGGEGSTSAEPAVGAEEAGFTILGLPACVGAHLLTYLDADGVRTLRLVCRSLYFEASKRVTSLVVTPTNLDVLVAQPLHVIMPALRSLVFRAASPPGAMLLPCVSAGPAPPPLALNPAQPLLMVAAAQGQQGANAPGLGEVPDVGQALQQGMDMLLLTGRVQGNFLATPAETALMLQFMLDVLPHLKELEVVDLTEAPLHAAAPVWTALLDNLPRPSTRLLLREHSAWARGAMGLLSTPEALRDGVDYYPEVFEAVRRAQRHCAARMVAAAAALATPTLMPGAAAGAVAVGAAGMAAGLAMDTPPSDSVSREEAREVLERGVHVRLPVQIDLLGITVRRNTSARLPQLCSLQCLTSLTLFGKSAAAAQHGHRLASHLAAVSGLRNLTRLELLSYEDVSDAELAPLAACPRLAHLYLDSLFIKQAVGPVFPSVVSLTAARVKFILRPLTTIFPALTRLRLGVLHSELNKKISSASLSCLAGCNEQLAQLCVCPVLWKGQWQVLPTLPGLTTLQLVHCRDFRHMHEVLRVVGRSPHLARLELHATSPTLPAWPGASNDGDGGAADAAAVAAAAALAGGMEGAVAAAAAAAAVAAAEEAVEASGSVLEANVYAGLTGCRSLRTLCISESSGRLVRHLVAADLPCLTRLELRRMGAGLRLADLQAAVLALPALQEVVIEASGDFTCAAALALPELLSRLSLQVTWRSTCSAAPLLFARDCGDNLLTSPAPDL